MEEMSDPSLQQVLQQARDALAEAKHDVRINRYKLDEECAHQSTLYLYYSDILADAKAQEDADEDELDKVLAEVEMKYRKDPPEDLKITDSVIKALVEKDLRVETAKEKLRKSKKWKYRVESVVNSLGHKKSELDNLVVLWSKGYYMVDTGHIRTGNDEASEASRGSLKERKES